jgi:hypothetical protein
VVTGQNPGWFIEVARDSEGSGGYFVYTYPKSLHGEGFDDWVLTRDDLEFYFTQEGLTVDWIDLTPPEELPLPRSG